MTGVEAQFYSAMVNDPTLGPLFGVDANGNKMFFVDQLVENPVYPAGRFQRISTVPLYVHTPGSGLQASVGQIRFQVDFWTRGKSAAQDRETICRAFLGALNAFNAYALPTSPSVVTQTPSYVLNRRHTVEPQTDPPLFKAIFDIKVWYQDQ